MRGTRWLLRSCSLSTSLRNRNRRLQIMRVAFMHRSLSRYSWLCCRADRTMEPKYIENHDLVPENAYRITDHDGIRFTRPFNIENDPFPENHIGLRWISVNEYRINEGRLHCKTGNFRVAEFSRFCFSGLFRGVKFPRFW